MNVYISQELSDSNMVFSHPADPFNQKLAMLPLPFQSLLWQALSGTSQMEIIQWIQLKQNILFILLTGHPVSDWLVDVLMNAMSSDSRSKATAIALLPDHQCPIAFHNLLRSIVATPTPSVAPKGSIDWDDWSGRRAMQLLGMTGAWKGWQSTRSPYVAALRPF